jgi:hypothetical protein
MFFAVLLLLAGAAPARAAPEESGIVARIAQAVEIAGAMRRCQLPADSRSSDEFEASWQEEIARTGDTLVSSLEFSAADAERLVAPMREVQPPFADTTPAEEVQSTCRALGNWKDRIDLLSPSRQFAAGKLDMPKPIEWAGKDDAAVTDALTNALHPWQAFISCNSTSMNYFVTMPSHWDRFRHEAIGQLSKYNLSPRAKLGAFRMLDFDHLFTPGRGTWGELKSYCAANAQLLKDIDNPDKKIMIQPAEVLRALAPAP